MATTYDPTKVPVTTSYDPTLGNTAAPASTTIPADQLNQTSPLIKIPPSTPDTTNGAGALAGVTADAANTKSSSTPVGDKYQGIADRIAALQGQDLGKTADTQAANTAAGVDTANANVKAVTDKINALNAESATAGLQIDEANQGKGIVSAIGARETAEANRQLAIKSQSLGVELAAAKGDLELAKNKAQQVIDLKYNPIEQEIAQKQSQLQTITPFLTAEQKKTADAQQAVLDRQKTDLADKKKLQGDILNAAQAAGQSDIASQILGLDSTSPTFAKDLAALQAKIINPDVALNTQLKKLQIAEAAANLAKTKAETLKINAQVNDQGDTVSTLAQSLIAGTLAPSDLSKRATGAGAYNDVLTAADKISLATTGKHFDIAKANIAYKYAQQPATQNTLKYLGSLVGGTGQTGNLDALVTLSNSIDRSTFPALNDISQWAQLQAGNAPIAAYYATLTEVSDQIAKVLQGGGSGSGTSDAKLAQASALFQKGFSKDQVVAVVSALKPLLANRAKNIIGDNPYLSDYADQFGTNTPSAADLLNQSTPGSSATSTTTGYTPAFWNTSGTIK